MEPPEYRFSVLPDIFDRETGFPARLDVIIRAVFPALSRRKISLMGKETRLLLNGRPAKPGDMLWGKEEISFQGYIEELLPGSKRLADNANPDIPELKVLYEDKYIVAVHKPRGIHSVLQKHSDEVTLADLLADYNPDLIHAGRNPRESGLVQRLDYWTSGVIVACKKREYWEFLHEMFISGKVEKTYIAEIARDITDIPSRYGSACIEVYEKLPESTLARITLCDGGRHIVRKIFSDMGYPLLGDDLYGSKTPGEGFYLHAEKLRIPYFENMELLLEDLPEK